MLPSNFEKKKKTESRIQNLDFTQTKGAGNFGSELAESRFWAF